MPRSRRLAAVLGAMVLLAVAAAGAFLVLHRSGTETAAACAGKDADADAGEARDKDKGEHGRRAANGLFAGPDQELDGPCGDAPGHPESFKDLAQANGALLTREVAPGTAIKPGAYRASVAGRAALPVTGGSWTPYGDTPLQSYRTAYDTTQNSTSEGLGNLSGRATAFARRPNGDLYVAASNGGIWKSTDGKSWTSIGDQLPTQVVSGLAYTPAGGGRLVVLTGDNSFGGDTYAGQGAYWTGDDGASWHHSTGIQDGLLGFKVAVDPTDGSRLYAATGGGLFRSTDGGASFTNVDLPTGPCAGKPTTVKDCFLANVVTDVVVQGAANANSAGGHPGAVLASVGWRAGTKHNADGVQQSPANGMYASDTGAPGTFADLDFAHHATSPGDPIDGQGRIGRIALGIAGGPEQDHRIVYAVVQDAVKFNGGASGIDVNDSTDGTTSAAQSDFLNAIYVSSDFGKTWTALEGSSAIDKDTTSNSALAPPTCAAPAAIAYCPGVQAWYNLWIEPDPTQATSAGVPTRLAFGLEEIWAANSPTGFGGTATVPDATKFSVVGRYFAGKSCTLLNLANGLPVCPTAAGGQVPAYTTHPDQHGGLWVPDGSGGATLYAANDGGVYRQHVAAGQQLDNAKWGQDDAQGRSGNNAGLHTLQPYDAEMAKDGTVYMGLQDNGEGKIDPDGTSYTIYGGDGFFTAVDPDHADHAYEEYTGGDISKTTDGGKTWTDIMPSGLTSAQFSTPLQMDPNDANHLMIGGRDVEETDAGTATTADSWAKVYDLGTRGHPGDASATSSASDPDNQLSAVDTLSFDAGSGAPTGPRTADLSYSGGTTTVPGTGDTTGTGTFVPGTYDDHRFTVGAGDGDAAVDVKVTWPSANDDWDLYLYRDVGGTLTKVGGSANGSTTAEEVALPNPPAGDYVVRVANYAATGGFDAAVHFTQRTSSAVHGSASYVGFCGFCDTITQGTPFGRGIATNVGGDKPGATGSSDGWHIAHANGLPMRYITSIRMDPTNPRTVFVTLAGYGRRWAFPGAVGEDASQIGTGHVFRSTDAGETFTDVTGDLPDTPANWSLIHNGHLVVGTDIGVFESCDTTGGAYSVLGTGLPTTPVSTMRLKPGDPDTMVVATYGRGVYTYHFGADTGRCPAAPGSGAGNGGGGTGSGPVAGSGGSGTGTGSGGTGTGGGVRGASACAATAAFRSVRVRPFGHGLRFTVRRRVLRPFTVRVFQRSSGRHVIARRVALLRRSGSFTWTPHGKLGAGIYVSRVSMRERRTRTDVRWATFRRRGSAFHARRNFHAPVGCRLLSSARLTGPAIGGTRATPLRIALRPVQRARVTVTVRQGARTLRRWSRRPSTRSLTRLTLPARRIGPGEVRIDLTARSGSARQSVRLQAVRLRR
jgi:hypothetical protein